MFETTMNFHPYCIFVQQDCRTGRNYIMPVDGKCKVGDCRVPCQCTPSTAAMIYGSVIGGNAPSLIEWELLAMADWPRVIRSSAARGYLLLLLLRATPVRTVTSVSAGPSLS